MAAELTHKVVENLRNFPTKRKNINKTKRPRKKFIAVDVWQKEFSPISVRAVFDVYQTRFNIETHNMSKHRFSDCVNKLRSLEDEDYIKPSDKSSY